MSVPRPTVPADQLTADGWDLIEDTERTFFESPMVTVRSRFVLYEDRPLRATLKEQTGIDQLWRSFFASRLRFAGPITAGLGTIIETLVRPQATTRFVRDLEDRGFRSVTRRGSRHLRIDSGHEASAIEYELQYPITQGELTAEGMSEDASMGQINGTAWLVIWAVDHDVLLSGGTYPRTRLSIEGSDAVSSFDPTAFRTELFTLIRAVTT